MIIGYNYVECVISKSISTGLKLRRKITRYIVTIDGRPTILINYARSLEINDVDKSLGLAEDASVGGDDKELG